MSSMKYATQIAKSKKKFFTSPEIGQLLEINKTRTLENVIKKLLQEKVILSLEKGKYLSTIQTASDFEIAQFIYSPSYISFETALNYHGILSQFPLEITSATTKKRVQKQFNQKVYSYSKLKTSLFTGYYKENDFLIAYPEKALFDQLNMIGKSLKTQEYLDELDYSNIKINQLKKYLNLVSKTTAANVNQLLKNHS